MKELKFRLVLLTIAVVFVCHVCIAQSTEPAVKMKTEKTDGYTVEYYEKDGETIKLVRKENGDFICSDESYCRFTLNDGTVIEGNNDRCIKGGEKLDWGSGSDLSTFVGTKIKFKNGNYLLMKDKVQWDWFFDKDLDSGKLLKELSSPVGFILAKEQNKKIHKMAILKGLWRGSDRSDNRKLVIIGDKAFDIKHDGELRIIAKRIQSTSLKGEVDSVYTYVNSKDSVLYRTEIDYQEYNKKFGEYSRSMYVIKYANGDEVYTDGSYIYNGTHIHRGDKLLEKKNKYYYWTMEDGRIFKSNINRAFAEIYMIGYLSNLCEETLTPYYGLMINKDNTGIKIVKGISEEENAAKEEAERKKAEAEKAKEDRENYNYLCKRFGKTYVDKALKGQVVIGMPELLFVATFKPTLKQQSGNRKLYYVYGWGTYDSSSKMTITNNQLKKKVWITNGKVSSIQIINN